MPGPEAIRGLVLAGGKSTRLGRDKTRLVFSGRSLLERAVALLRQVADEAWVSGTDPADLGCDAPWLPDDVPGQGPMGGILTALNRLGGPVLALACDMPLMRAEVLEKLVRARSARPSGAVATMYQDAATGRLEPLVAVYETDAAGLLSRSAAGGRFALSRAVPPEHRLVVPRGPGMSRAFLNLNTPGDLEELTALAALEPEADMAGAGAAVEVRS